MKNTGPEELSLIKTAARIHSGHVIKISDKCPDDVDGSFHDCLNSRISFSYRLDVRKTSVSDILEYNGRDTIRSNAWLAMGMSERAYPQVRDNTDAYGGE